MFQAAQGRNPSADLQHNLQAASRVFHANRSMLTNHQVCVKDRLTFFQGSPYIFHADVSLTRGFEMKMVTPGACFATGNRKIFKQELAALDVAHRKLLRRVVGPPAGMDRSRPGTKSCTSGTCEFQFLWARRGLKLWSHTCLEQHWKFGHYAVSQKSKFTPWWIYEIIIL